MLLAACNTGGYKVTGTIKGLEGTVYLLDEYGTEINSSAVRNGRFSFSGTTDEIKPVLLSDGAEVFAMFFLENGGIKIGGSFADGGIEATGTLANDRSTQYDREFNEFVEGFIAGNENPDIEAFMAESNILTEKSVDANLDNFFGLYLLSELQREWSVDKILEKLEQFPPEISGTSYGRTIRESIEQKQKSDVGRPYMDITLPGRDGEQISLSSYVGEGKFVLVDFWAGWCGPCMEELPHLKEAYRKHHAKGFEIFAVSLDRGKEQWIRTVDDNKMNWVQVFNEQGNSATGDYSIETIPANFLISPQGTIIAKDLRGKDLLMILDSIVK